MRGSVKQPFNYISPYEFTTCHEKRHSIPPNILDKHCQTQNSCRSQLHREKSERMEYRSMNGMTKKKCGRCEDSSCDVRCWLFAVVFVNRPLSRKYRAPRFNEKYSLSLDFRIVLAISAFRYFLYCLKKRRSNKSRIPFAF